MSALSPILRSLEGGKVAFWCPGCNEAHAIDLAIWTWNGDAEAPTFLPSISVRSGHYANDTHPCWCDYGVEYPDDPSPFKCGVCHSYVRDGSIEFLGDCTHSLAGQTVPLPPWDGGAA